VLRFLPPLVMTDEQARVGMDVVADVVDDLAAEVTDGADVSPRGG
jgi:acetylornithine/succinyldiaminopimelate/putrescine aminotransferase